MTDFALVWNDAEQFADFSIVNGDLALDEGLQTAVIISLGTDRLAADDDDLPDQSGDRRGWWGDMPTDPGTSDSRRYPIGSRLWLLRRSKFNNSTPARAVGYAREALQWLLDDGVAREIYISVMRQAQPPGTLVLGIAITRNTPSAAGSTVFNAQWLAQLGT